jgi:hypothetical protein
MRIIREGDALTGTVVDRPSFGKHQLPNPERKNSRINMVLLTHRTKFQEHNFTSYKNSKKYIKGKEFCYTFSVIGIYIKHQSHEEKQKPAKKVPRI